MELADIFAPVTQKHLIELWNQLNKTYREHVIIAAIAALRCQSEEDRKAATME